jgi:serine/threonine-protein kinase
MLDRWGKIRVMDFGLARAPGHQRITVAKTLVGSIYYASPEQVWGYTLDNRSDIYALGVVLYEMVSGYRPFTGRSMLELTQAITGGALQPPRVHNPELSPELEQIILKAMARDRDQRYEDAGFMAHALRELNLKPPAHAVADGTAALSASTRPYVPLTPRERIIVHPPKRPQAQRPSYFDDSETTQPLGDESASLLTHSPDMSSSYEGQDIDGPTHPLQITQASAHLNTVDNQSEASTQRPLRKVPARRTLWNQLQHLFRSPLQ